MPNRTATYRRRGPDGLSPSLGRLLDGVAGTVNRQLRGHRALRVAAAASVPVAVGLIAARRRLGLRPVLTLPR